MMKLESVRVFVEYRYKSGPGEPPRLKDLMARVFDDDPDGEPVFGSNILGNRNITNIPTAINLVRRELEPKVKHVWFIYDPVLCRRPESFTL